MRNVELNRIAELLNQAHILIAGYIICEIDPDNLPALSHLILAKQHMDLCIHELDCADDDLEYLA